VKKILVLLLIAVALSFLTCWWVCAHRGHVVASSSFGPYGHRARVVVREKGNASACSYTCEYYPSGTCKPVTVEWNDKFIAKSINIKMDGIDDGIVFIDREATCVLKGGRWIGLIHHAAMP